MSVQLEGHLETWEENGYDKRELYHIIHREYVRVYGHHLKERDLQDNYSRGKK